MYQSTDQILNKGALARNTRMKSVHRPKYNKAPAEGYIVPDGKGGFSPEAWAEFLRVRRAQSEAAIARAIDRLEEDGYPIDHADPDDPDLCAWAPESMQPQ